ncbi:MAG: alpha/beta hydrolase [Methylococcales bacterium]|jgi:triacylglycerol lipase|nr:alpha/beta hydrolase [Methylococcales bacterium]
MKKATNTLLGLILLSITQFSHADVAVLIHGYLGGTYSWNNTGITQQLNNKGWTYSGAYLSSPAGIQYFPAQNSETKPTNKTVLVNLPSQAPIVIQINILQEALKQINNQYNDEPLILIGHSLGGVVARAVLTRNTINNAKTLISIASPHLGTPRVFQGINATNNSFPVSIVRSFFGGNTYRTAQRSRRLYHDLLPARAGTFLYWLNNQAHPDIAYYSVIRRNRYGFPGDNVVPGYSQDMNNVTALKGKSSNTTTPSYHNLTPQDGSIILGILNKK